MRLLRSARLSRSHDSSTALEKQDLKTNAYAEAFSHEIVGTAADSNVSGKTDPFQRPELGPWLTDPARMASYDGIIASHLDRLGRSTRHISRLLDWAEDHGKTVICVEPAIDFSTPVGKLIAFIISWLAEQELELITKRSNDTREFLIDNGFLVGKPPWGYLIVPSGDHKTIAPDPKLVPYVIQMFERYLDGHTLTAICEWLDAEGISPPGGAVIWNLRSAGEILRNPVYGTGRRVNGAGKTILRTEPIVEAALQRKVIEKLASNPRRRGAIAPDAALLAGIIFCDTCGRPMYRKHASTGMVYRCNGTMREPSTCKNNISLEETDARVDRYMRVTMARWPRYETIVVPGNDHEDEIADVERDLSELDWDDPSFLTRQSELLALRASLKALPSEPSQIARRSTGDMIGSHWATLTTDSERRDFLQSLGLKLRVVPRSVRREDRVTFETFGNGADLGEFTRPGAFDGDDDDDLEQFDLIDEPELTGE
jgi:site-specific DNA recombinase